MSKGKRTRLTGEARRDLIEEAGKATFAEHGYRGATMDEIARRAGVSAPVVYDHFSSKLDLYRRLLERTRNELLEMWGATLFGEEPFEERIPRALEAWATYVESNREGTRMLFRQATGDPEAEAVHDEIAAQTRVALGVVIAREPEAEVLAGGRTQEGFEMVGEILRSGLTGLALWWHDHPHVPRERIVKVAVNVLWMGFQGVRDEASG